VIATSVIKIVKKIELFFTIYSILKLNMPFSEVQKVLEQVRLEKARQRKLREERRRHEPRLVLTDAQKAKLIANNISATQEGKDDCKKWLALKKQHSINKLPIHT
jgi:hypothetical protein